MIRMKKRDRIMLIFALGLVVVLLGLLIFHLTPGQKYKRTIAEANRYMEAQEYEQALLMYEAAIEIKPNEAEPHIGMGNAYLYLAQSCSDKETGRMLEYYRLAQKAYKAAASYTSDKKELDKLERNLEEISKVLSETAKKNEKAVQNRNGQKADSGKQEPSASTDEEDKEKQAADPQNTVPQEPDENNPDAYNTDEQDESTKENGSDIWTGVYRYDDGDQGLYFFVTEADDAYVKGYNIFELAAGGYSYGIIDWEVENGNAGRASGPFNGNGKIYYSRTDEGILADYPDGWWPDRLYQQVDTIEAFKAQYPQMEWEDIMKQMISGGSDGSSAAAEPAAEQSEGNTALAPFYGVWVSASQSETDCVRMAEELQNKGFAAKVYDTVDWENLNAEHWFVVSAGEYSTEAAADQVCSQVIAAGYAGAYVKYTGNHR